MSSSIQESLSDMMKQIQSSLKKKENIHEIHKTPTKKGGGPFDFIKKYLDMVFSKEEKLKKDQQDSLQRLTEIKEQQQKQAEEDEQKRQNIEQQNLLAEKKEFVEDAKKDALILQDHASVVHDQTLQIEKEAEENLQKANEHAQNAQLVFEKAQLDEEKLEKDIENHKKSQEEAEKNMKELFQQMENKELVSLEETEEARGENSAIEEIQTIANSGIIEKKTDDVLI